MWKGFRGVNTLQGTADAEMKTLTLAEHAVSLHTPDTVCSTGFAFISCEAFPGGPRSNFLEEVIVSAYYRCWQLIAHALEGDGEVCEHLILIVHLQGQEAATEEEGDELRSHTFSDSG